MNTKRLVIMRVRGRFPSAGKRENAAENEVASAHKKHVQ